MQAPRSMSAALALAAALTAPLAASAAPVYITVGDEAWSLVAARASDARVLGSRDVPVTVPVQRGARETTRSSERVHAVEVDERWLEVLSEAVHQRLHRCGGFAQHESMAEALATLHRIDSSPVPGLAPSYAIDDAAVVDPMLSLLQDSRILTTIESLAQFQNRLYTSPTGVEASDWLAQQWRTLAGTRSWVQVEQVRHPGWPQKSVLLRIAGNGANAAETVVLGAHLDSINGTAANTRAPGADDDASGVASLTEVIRVLMDRNFRPSRTIEFVAYAAEEVGLRGSAQIATRYKRQGKPVVGVLQLDMTAYQGDATDLWIYTDYTDAAQNQFLANLAATYLPQLTVGYDRCGYGCSDHASWTGKGFAASFPFESSFANYNRTIHTANDTTAAFGTQALHALKFTQLALAYAVELGAD
jgi:leucyl aminopeptidase